MIKAGTVMELTQFEKAIDRDVYRAALRIVTILDEAYGAGRDVDNSDGGFVLIAENFKDIADIGQQYVALDANQHEAVDFVKCESMDYVNALFLTNNEYGINVFMPVDIAPRVLLRYLPQKSR